MNEKQKKIFKKNIVKEPLLEYKLRDILSMTDIYTIGILFIYSMMAMVFFKYIIDAQTYIYINLFLIIAIFSLGILDEKVNAGRIFKIIRYLYVVPLIFFIYTQVQVYIRVINPGLHDNFLINLDYFIFGLNPTQWIAKFSNPYLTDYFQLSYMLYFVMPLAVGFDLVINKRFDDYKVFCRTMVFGFYVSYLLYFILPSVGPRFFLHSFNNMNIDLPGMYITNFLREIVNVGGGIKPDSINPMMDVNRDCMPSGHTMLTLVNIFLASRFHSKFRWFVYVFGFSLIFATIYLRYHYVVDVLAGVLFAFLVLWLEPKIRQIFLNKGFIKA